MIGAGRSLSLPRRIVCGMRQRVTNRSEPVDDDLEEWIAEQEAIADELDDKSAR